MVSLLENLARTATAAASSDPLGSSTPFRINEVVDGGVESGFFLTAIAAAVDSAAMATPLEVSAVLRATVLNRAEWNEHMTGDDVPPAWLDTALHLAASMAGSGQPGMDVLHATAELGDGGRIALAGILNPAFTTPSITDVSWHPQLSYPPVAGIALLSDSATVDEIARLGEPFLTATESPSWAVAGLVGLNALIPWPEWEGIIDWVAQEEPLGTVAYWTWLISNIDSPGLSEVLGRDGQWLEVGLWQEIADTRLRPLLEDTTVDEAELKDQIRQTRWPAVDGLR